MLYPKGHGNGTGTHLSLFLQWTEFAAATPTFKVYADFVEKIAYQHMLF